MPRCLTWKWWFEPWLQHALISHLPVSLYCPSNKNVKKSLKKKSIITFKLNNITITKHKDLEKTLDCWDIELSVLPCLGCSSTAACQQEEKWEGARCCRQVWMKVWLHSCKGAVMPHVIFSHTPRLGCLKGAKTDTS